MIDNAPHTTDQHSQLGSLIKMINQIAANLSHHQSEEQAAKQVAHHLQRFWARSMKEEILVYYKNDGAQLLPVAQKALAQMP